MKILMVCMGNICRSPLAEGILKNLALQRGLDWEIDSAGTTDWHEGEAPDPRSVKIALNHGIDISRQRSRPIRARDLNDFDLIFAMDKKNLRDILSLKGAQQHNSQIKLILKEVRDSRLEEVPDPYYDGLDGFEEVFKLLSGACTQIIQHWGINKSFIGFVP